jgi:hypothetical protein
MKRAPRTMGALSVLSLFGLLSLLSVSTSFTLYGNTNRRLIQRDFMQFSSFQEVVPTTIDSAFSNIKTKKNDDKAILTIPNIISFFTRALLASSLSILLTTTTPVITHAATSTTSTTITRYPLIGSNSIMSKKAHGTSEKPVQANLRWNVDSALADRIVNFNRHFAEYAGYFIQGMHSIIQIFIFNPSYLAVAILGSSFLAEEADHSVDNPLYFYDSVTGVPLFHTPTTSRTYKGFIEESKVHGWPSFRDDEVDWNHVRVLGDGEVVSLSGSHLGHNLPDRHGNRYCINLVSIAGYPTE